MPTGIETTIRVIWVLLTRLVVAAGGAYVLYRVRSILIALLISVLLTYALLPFVDGLCRRYKTRQKPKNERLIVTVFVFSVFLALMVMVVGVIVTPFSQEVAKFTQSAQGYADQINGLVAGVSQWYGKAVPDDVKSFIGELDYSSLTASMSEYVKGALTTTTHWLSYLLELVLIPVLAFYFVLDYRSLSREFYGLVPKARRKEAIRLGRDAGRILQSYVVGQVILCLIAGVLTAIVLGALNVPYVVVLALFAAVTRAIPVIGPVVSGVPIVLVGLLNFPGYSMALWLLAFVVVMHFAESKFIMPKLIGDRLHLHPAVVIVVLLIGAEFFGLVGMFLAAPVAAIARELIRLYYIRPRERAALAGVSEQQEESPLTAVGT